MTWARTFRHHLRRLPEVAQVRGIADALLAAILAPACAACARLLEHPTRGPVCEACWAEIRIGPLLSERAGPLDAYRAAGPYQDALRGVIRAFKYEGRRTLAVPLGRLVCAAGQDLLHTAACVVPVPLHRWKHFRRGFNQAADLAAVLNLPVLHALERTRATVPQSGLTAAERRRNVRGAFSTSPHLAPRAHHELLVDQAVVLVDDVRTTGATLRACARVLKRAGAREVRALTVAWARPAAPHGRQPRD